VKVAHSASKASVLLMETPTARASFAKMPEKSSAHRRCRSAWHETHDGHLAHQGPGFGTQQTDLKAEAVGSTVSFRLHPDASTTQSEFGCSLPGQIVI
jgi:hypothetical protein